MILPYLARIRITIAATRVVRDRRSAAACVVIIVVEGFQRGRTELSAIETIKVEGRGISASPLQHLGRERGWGEDGGMLATCSCDESVVRVFRRTRLYVPRQSRYRSHSQGCWSRKQNRVGGNLRGGHLYPTTCTNAVGAEGGVD